MQFCKYRRDSLSLAQDYHHPWGYYTVLSEIAGCKVKRIVVLPGKRLSLQRHAQRNEHWFIVSGEGIVTQHDTEVPCREGSSFDIPYGALHRIQNTGTQDIVFIEVQTGAYCGEDDIERVADDYGRA